jgi:two-component system cell cycle response regulator CtrA
LPFNVLRQLRVSKVESPILILSGVANNAQSAINTDHLCVNLDSKTVEIDGARLHVTNKEYQMLELMSLRKGTTQTKELLLNHLYGGMNEPDMKIIDVFICKPKKTR